MITRNLEKAKQAYKNRDSESSQKAHMGFYAPENHQLAHGQYIKSAIYGGLDGTITTFAVVAGVAGASLSPGIVLILGFANLIADGISMAIGDFLSTKAEKEYNKTEREREAWEVENFPDGEKQELIELYSAKGIEKKDAETIVYILSKNKKAWVDVMMVEELGILESKESPLKNALVTFLSFAVFGFVPLITYILARFITGLEAQTFIMACVLTAITLFTLGALKTYVTKQKWFISGLEMFFVGGLAATSAYLIGTFLSGLA